MKDILNSFKIILFLAFIIISKEQTCAGDEISITALGGGCVTIQNFLEKKDLSIVSENLLYLASNNQGIIEKNDYKIKILKLNDEKLQSQNIQKSNLYIPKSCIEAMEKDEKIKLDKTKGIVILAFNSNKINQYHLPEIFFVIRHDGENSQIKYMNSKNFDFSFCHNDPILLDNQININDLKYDLADDTPINMDKVMYAKKLKVDLFDPHSPFLTDICFKFTSEYHTDVTLESRLEDYYQKITLCNETERSHYIGFSYSTTDKQFTYRCAYGFYENEEQKNTYVNKISAIDDKMSGIFSSSNLKVITCFEQLFNLKNLIHNFGGILCFSVLIVQIILYIHYCCKGAKPLQNQINNMFKEADEYIKKDNQKTEENANSNEALTDDRLKNNNNNEAATNENEKSPTDITNNPDNNLIQKEPENNVNINTNGVKRKKGKKKTGKKASINTIANPKKKKKKKTTKPTFNVEKKDDENGNEDLNKENKEDGEKKKKKKTNLEEKKEKEKAKEKFKEKQLEVKSEKRIYEYNDEEKNGLSYEKALKHDKRNFCQYYGFMLQISHIIVNVFCRCKDYNLFTVKLGLLFMLFPINITFNSFFYTSKKIQANYSDALNDASSILDYVLHTFISSVCSSVILILLKLLCLTHGSIMSLRKIKDVQKARKRSEWTIRCIKLRIFIYYLLSFIFLLIFGYYVACFCTIFENTQVDLIKAMFTSWALSLIYPLIICFVTAIFRILALRCKKKFLYRINQLLQMI